MKKEIIISAFIFSYFSLTSVSQAVELDFTCMRYDDPSKVITLREHLDTGNILHYVSDKTTICVSPKDKEDFHNIARAIFPPNYDKTKQISVPDSPSGIPLQSIKIINHKLHQQLKLKLAEHNIWFTEDEREAIWYEVTNRQIVDKLSDQLWQKKFNNE